MNDQLSGPLYARRHVLEHTCQESVGHKHNYDHTTLVLRGRILVIATTEDGTELWRNEYGWGERVPIAAQVLHTIKALEPNTVYDCEFSHRDFDGQVSQRYVGNQQAFV